MVPRFLPRAYAISLAICVLCACVLGSLFATDASASVSIAITYDALLQESAAAAFVTSAESLPVWESGRIYTYNKVHVDRPVAGALSAGTDAWVRTMGGVVGKVGQVVEGEASFAPGEASLLFLRPGPTAGSFVVTARGQGQFPVVTVGPTGTRRVVRSTAVGMLVMPRTDASTVANATVGATPRLAADVLHGRLLDDVARDIAAGWGAAHAH